MNKFRQMMEQFLYGRYGIDELNRCLFALYLLFFLLNLITQDTLFYTLSICTIAYTLFRCFSRNIEARRRENEKILSVINKLKKQRNLCKRMWNDRHTHVYRRCPHCKSMLRFPKKKGKHTATCPKCHQDFEVKG